MNKQKEQQLKELQNKYFWEQKIEEAFLYPLIVAGFVLCWFMAGSIILELEGSVEEFGTDSIFVLGLVGLIFFIAVGLMLWGIYELFKMIIESWIESNENKARARAKIELGIKPDSWGDY